MKVLVVKIGGIGDVIMALPLLRALREDHGETHIAWVVGRSAAPLIEQLGGVDELIVVDERVLLAGRVGPRLIAACRVLFRLAGRRYDKVLTLHADPRYRWLTALVRAGERVHLGRRRGARPAVIPGRYVPDELLRTVAGIDGPSMPHARLPTLALDPPRAIADRLAGEGALVCLAPGGARNALRDDALRRWPVSHWVELARGVLQKGARVCLVGGPEDRPLAAAFAELECIDLLGQTTVLETVAVFGRADCVVAVDSGPLHMALLAGVPVVALFGPTPPWWVPRYEVRAVVLWGGADLACRPCYDGRDYAPCPNNLCLQQLTPRTVLDAVLRQIGLRD